MLTAGIAAGAYLASVNSHSDLHAKHSPSAWVLHTVLILGVYPGMSGLTDFDRVRPGTESLTGWPLALWLLPSGSATLADWETAPAAQVSSRGCRPALAPFAQPQRLNLAAWRASGLGCSQCTTPCCRVAGDAAAAGPGQVQAAPGRRGQCRMAAAGQGGAAMEGEEGPETVATVSNEVGGVRACSRAPHPARRQGEVLWRVSPRLAPSHQPVLGLRSAEAP